MEPKLFCQSCTLPIDDATSKGTEKDGSLSNEYCKYCYQQGIFTTEDMSVEKMKTIIEQQMKNRHIPENIIHLSLNMLPQLKRWNKAKV